MIRVRQLVETDLDEALFLLRQRPIANLFVISRLIKYGCNPLNLGNDVLGFWRKKQLVGICHVGTNLVPVSDDEEVLSIMAKHLGTRTIQGSIMGEAYPALTLHKKLSEYWGISWQKVRNIRPRQFLMSLCQPPAIMADPRVRKIEIEEFDSYFDASVRMYQEEVGVSPLVVGGGYDEFVRQRIFSGDALGIVKNGQVIFKTDIGPTADQICQIQGVWLDPNYRGLKIAEPALARVIEICQQQYKVVSLCVNDFNIPAIAAYRKVGFQQIDMMAVVHY